MNSSLFSVKKKKPPQERCRVLLACDAETFSMSNLVVYAFVADMFERK